MSRFFRWDGKDVVIDVHVQPRASRDEFAGEHGDALKVRITAAPVDGKANACLTAMLAKAFGVPRSRIELVSGATSRQKRFRIREPGKLPDFLSTD